jgi:hypothetical protein
MIHMAVFLPNGALTKIRTARCGFGLSVDGGAR